MVPTDLAEVFSELFLCLDLLEYQWQPQIPDRLIKLRKTKDHFGILDQYFGLGIPVHPEQLIKEGLPLPVVQSVYPLGLAISRNGPDFIPHSHWPGRPEKAKDFVHFGMESLNLIYILREFLSDFSGQSVLELGSGAGAALLEIGRVAKRGVGLDCCEMAVQLSNSAAKAQGRSNVRFYTYSIGSTGKVPEVLQETPGNRGWDRMVFNPPFVIPNSKTPYPHKDGGERGIEIPLKFLDFSDCYLAENGAVYCLMSSPVIRGRAILFDKLKQKKWKILEKRCLHTEFNQQLYHLPEYRAAEIDVIELYFLKMQR